MGDFPRAAPCRARPLPFWVGSTEHFRIWRHPAPKLYPLSQLTPHAFFQRYHIYSHLYSLEYLKMTVMCSPACSVVGKRTPNLPSQFPHFVVALCLAACMQLPQKWYTYNITMYAHILETTSDQFNVVIRAGGEHDDDERKQKATSDLAPASASYIRYKKGNPTRHGTCRQSRGCA